MSRGTQAIISLEALRHNFNLVKELTANSCRILAMIKSNAYGHGLIRIAHALTLADAFGVACIEEALQLREAKVTQPIIVMAGFFSPNEIPLFLQYKLTAVIHHPSQLDILQRVQSEQLLSVWLKVDTGMHRLGVSPEEFKKTYGFLQNHSSIRKPIKLMTHLADADNQDHKFTEKQMAIFDELTKEINVPKSVSNSAAILRYPCSWHHWVRPGIMLYGVSPFADQAGKQYHLKPVMTLKSKLIAIKRLKLGETVGYGCTWRCPEKMMIGIVAIGYGDGYPRHAKNGTPTRIRNAICPLIGRVSMDMIAVDLRQSPNARVGDVVELWGKHLPVEKIAACADTIAYEIAV